jgi:SHS2 domain-containing protein
MNAEITGYLEIEHTADWELKVWAPDLSTLFEQAALGMYSLAGAIFQTEPRISRSIELQNVDEESLLVDFLSELLYFSEVERAGFDSFEICFNGNVLNANLFGAPLETLSKEIKAVTYHNLAIIKGAAGLEVSIVFDV